MAITTQIRDQSEFHMLVPSTMLSTSRHCGLKMRAYLIHFISILIYPRPILDLARVRADLSSFPHSRASAPPQSHGRRLNLLNVLSIIGQNIYPTFSDARHDARLPHVTSAPSFRVLPRYQICTPRAVIRSPLRTPPAVTLQALARLLAFINDQELLTASEIHRVAERFLS